MKRISDEEIKKSADKYPRWMPNYGAIDEILQAQLDSCEKERKEEVEEIFRLAFWNAREGKPRQFINAPVLWNEQADQLKEKLTGGEL